jgi:hypothetical protein
MRAGLLALFQRPVLEQAFVKSGACSKKELKSGARSGPTRAASSQHCPACAQLPAGVESPPPPKRPGSAQLAILPTSPRAPAAASRRQQQLLLWQRRRRWQISCTVCHICRSPPAAIEQLPAPSAAGLCHAALRAEGMRALFVAPAGDGVKYHLLLQQRSLNPSLSSSREQELLQSPAATLWRPHHPCLAGASLLAVARGLWQIPRVEPCLLVV